MLTRSRDCHSMAEAYEFLAELLCESDPDEAARWLASARHRLPAARSHYDGRVL
ncbi:MAG: hypothetical protein ACK5AZ_12840 [Bryobacteraceae bacterium]